MDREAMINFFNIIGKLNNEEYLYNLIGFYGAPVIDGKRPAFTINLSRRDRDLLSIWEVEKNYIKEKYQIDYHEIFSDNSRKLILIYETNSLCGFVHREDEYEYLQELGYKQLDNLQLLLGELSYNFTKGIPHEIGIFLGIPIGDVEGFIKNQGRNYLINGYWKVYTNYRLAMELFKSYDDSRNRAIRTLSNKLN